MTSLERARTYLLRCQKRLRIHREGFYELEHAEDDFLAALSWVWEEQEKDPQTQAERLIAMAARVRERVAVRERFNDIANGRD